LSIYFLLLELLIFIREEAEQIVNFFEYIEKTSPSKHTETIKSILALAAKE